MDTQTLELDLTQRIESEIVQKDRGKRLDHYFDVIDTLTNERKVYFDYNLPASGVVKINLIGYNAKGERDSIGKNTEYLIPAYQKFEQMVREDYVAVTRVRVSCDKEEAKYLVLLGFRDKTFWLPRLLGLRKLEKQL